MKDKSAALKAEIAFKKLDRRGKNAAMREAKSLADYFQVRT